MPAGQITFLRWVYGLSWRVGLMVTMFLIAVFSLYEVMIRRANAGNDPLTAFPPQAIGPRILIVAPHPDDETLGVAGLIQQAVLAGSDVRVIFMTNGDGFRRGILEEYSHKVLNSKEYISYGQLRQQEALTALGTLGLSREQIVFLGYPDGGLATIWNNYWDPSQPYTSRYTKCSVSPYGNSYRPAAPYTAVAVLSDLERYLMEFRPTQIFLPHPDDTHRDHWATSLFVAASVSRMDITIRPERYSYIIHRGVWQLIKGFQSASVYKPPVGAQGDDTTWYNFPLPPEMISKKEKAVRQYQTQVKIMRDFLFNFVQPNEIYGSLAVWELQLPERKSQYAGKYRDWPDLQPANGPGSENTQVS